MQDPFLHKKFIFSDNIDSEFLFSLYEDDLLYIEEIFKTTLDQVKPIVQELPGAFASRDLENVKRMVHKIKPAFGFTGFVKTEKACKDFESACAESRPLEELANSFNDLLPLLERSMHTMQQEYDHLKEFNNA